MTDQVIEAGGIAPVSDSSSGDGDLLTVRVYRHPGLGDDAADRPVVRLVAQTLGEAEDLTMSFLGFGAPERTEPVGVAARQALGFPAWALVHDPANGRHALAMVKQMRKVAKQAATKPAFAMDDYQSMAGTLGNAAPQFLPTFWEEAGRAFLAGENARFAATCFNRAREAEQVHALEVDEDRVADVFLEYALAGALPVKAISQYARDLAARSKPDEAFERFRTVTVRRVAGGMAPYAALPAEIKRLATAAGVPADAAVEDLVAELIGLAATARSAPGTWKAMRPAILRAAKRRPEVRGRLLAMLPDPPGYDTDMTDEWIDLLTASGADAGLVDPSAEPAAASRDGAASGRSEAEPAVKQPRLATCADGSAGWLERVARQRNRSWRTKRSAALLSLVERMLPALRAAGRPVTLADDDDADLDLVDLCLAGDVDVAWTGDPDPNAGTWVDDTEPGRRDLAALAADERFARSLAKSVVRSVRGGGERLSTVLGAGPRSALADWLRRKAGAVPADPTALGLAGFAERLDWVTTPAAAALAPDALRRLATVDVAAGLTRTLRTGLLAEFAWPALDEARADLPEDVQFGGSWPHLVLYTRKKAVVLGPDGVVLAHRFSKEVQGWWPDAAWVPGVDRLIVFSYGRSYWADAPDEPFDENPRGLDDARLLPLPDGSATFGAAPWRPGDPEFPDPERVISDGERYWVLREVEGTHRWRPYDPVTGAVTAGDPPAFLAGDGVHHPASDLVPAPAAFAGSPFGYADGLVGWRVATRDGVIVGARVDGREVVFPAEVVKHRHAAGGLIFPGTEVVCPVTASGIGPGQGSITVYTPAGDQPLAAGSPDRDLPPTEWWHAWNVRDEAGSAALRGIGAPVVRALLDAVVAALSADDRAAGSRTGEKATASAERDLFAAITALAADAVPGVTDSRLREAIASAARDAGRLSQRLRTLAALADAGPGDAEPKPVTESVAIDRGAVQEFLRDLDHQIWIDDDDVRGAAAQLAALPTVLAGGDLPAWPNTDLDWAFLLALQPHLAARAATVATPEPQRQAIVTVLSLLAASGLAEADGTVRVAYVSAAKKAFRVPQVIRSGERTTVVVSRSGYKEYTFTVVEHDPTGTFGPIEGGEITGERRAGWGGRERLDALLARVRADGPAPWRPEAVDDLVAATGMSRGTAIMLLSGLPNVHAYEANFLPKDTRTALGISVAEARSGRDTLNSLKKPQRRDLLAATVPDDPTVLWTAGPDVAGAARMWTSLFGTRLTIPDDVLADAKRADRWQLPRALLALAAEPEWTRSAGASSEPKGFAGDLAGIGPALQWLAYRLPLDSPLQPVLVRWYDRALVQLANPKLRIDVGYLSKGTPLPPSVTATKSGEDYVKCSMAPASLTGPDDPALAMFPSDQDVASIRRLLDPAMAELIAAIRADCDGAGRTGWAQNPASEVPDLVAEVAAHHGLPADPAAYYLQLLALGDPTDRNVIRWTGWTAARLRKARTALAAAGLVVEAKREGAGRSAFLPGGWLKSPPVEEWKRAALGLDLEGHGTRLADAPPRTPAALFRAAWQRVLSGDPPRLRDLGAKR